MQYSELLDIANSLNLIVEESPLMCHPLGLYIDSLGVIFLKPGLPPILKRWVLAHEIGHHITGDAELAYYHNKITGANLTPSESKAEAWAWRALVDKDELESCKHEGLDAEMTAYRLRVPLEAVLRWRNRQPLRPD